MLENLSAQFALLCQKLFSEQNCRSWREYNQAMRRNSAPRKQLPYKVLICFDLPEQCKQEFYKNATPLEKAFTRLNEQPITFDEMIGFDNFFDTSALNGLQIPLGISLQNNELLKLPVGDFPVHTLIAGMTGSGKSNLLHVMICNACARYLPDELNLGVEFATYAKPPLPHAKLIAT